MVGAAHGCAGSAMSSALDDQSLFSIARGESGTPLDDVLAELEDEGAS